MWVGPFDVSATWRKSNGRQGGEGKKDPTIPPPPPTLPPPLGASQPPGEGVNSPRGGEGREGLSEIPL